MSLLATPGRFLIVDNALDRTLLPEGYLTARLLAQPAEVVYAPGGQLPADLVGYSGVLLGGSEASVHDGCPWLDAERALIRECLARDVPLLGICFGAQLLCATLWGDDCVRRMDAPEIGWVRVQLDGQSPLFSGLPDEVVSWSGHYWGFLPEAEPLARSAQWPQQAFQVPGRRAWGVQFYPEVGWVYGNLRNLYERVRTPGLRVHRQGRPTAPAFRRLMANYCRLCRASRGEAG